MLVVAQSRASVEGHVMSCRLLDAAQDRRANPVLDGRCSAVQDRQEESKRDAPHGTR